MMTFLWIILSYLLGSIPFGYLISRLSGKNVLEIGWRKTSGSNVFKNVGKLQGVITGILDISKGWLAVYGARKLGLSTEIQIFSGVAAVTGHNWSIFLKFAGGRGIGTFIGGFFALAPKILGFSLIPLISLTLIWNAAIGTLLFLATAIFLSIYPPSFLAESQPGIAGVFAALSLVPILIKRLSPLKEIFQVKNSLVLFRNRLLFDNDQTLFGFRIKRIFQKEKPSTRAELGAGLVPHRNKVSGAGNNPSRLMKIVKPLATPFLLPPKIGWKVAKFGIKIAAKPIYPVRKAFSYGVQKILAPEKIVTEIKIEDFKKMMLASAGKIVLHQEEINRINVWPVADKDTGYNLAATLLGIEGVIGQKEYKSFLELTRDIKEGAMINARGNAGMIFTGYIIRFLGQIKNLEQVDSFRLGLAMRKGTKAAYHSIMNPTEGTILDVMKAAGEKTYEMAKIKRENNIIKILEEVQKVSKLALAETKEKLEVLKQNDVVDAGALGFVKILEAWLESLKGVNQLPERGVAKPAISESKTEEKLEYQYDLVFRIRKIKEEQLEKLKNDFSQIGGSIDIIESEREAKFHIHTNLPEKVREKLKDFEILEWRIKDMAVQVGKITEKQPLGLIVGESADLPREFLEKNQFIEIPFSVRFPDGEIVAKENLFPKIRQAVKTGRPLPTTSAPSFKEFLSAYQKALEKFEEILVITISSKLSGAYSSARIARSMLENKQRVTVFDCFTAEVGEALVAEKIQELISQGKNKNEILEILRDFCPKIKLIGGLKDFSYLARSGRVHLPKIGAKIISFLSTIAIQFLFVVREGKVRFLGIRFGKDLVKILVQEIEKEPSTRAKLGAGLVPHRNEVSGAGQKDEKLKAAIAYGDNLKEALKLKEKLERNEKIKILFLSQVSSVVGVYTGPEVLIIGLCPS